MKDVGCCASPSTNLFFYAESYLCFRCILIIKMRCRNENILLIAPLSKYVFKVKFSFVNS